jgi:hypothetical protein
MQFALKYIFYEWQARVPAELREEDARLDLIDSDRVRMDTLAFAGFSNLER